MAAGQDEAVPVEPLRLLRVVLEDVGVEDCPDLFISARDQFFWFYKKIIGYDYSRKVKLS